MTGLSDTAIALFQRRFLTNAFLPVLLFLPAVLMPILLQDGRLQVWGNDWAAQITVLKVLEVVIYLAGVWFVAAILESQLRNVTQLFEGYRFQRLGSLTRAATWWHRRRRENLDRAPDPSGRHYAYALDPNTELLPTRLGNILRAAEHYAIDRYNADLFLLWPRLYRAFPADFARNLEDTRARMEFLLVVSLWSAAFGTSTLAMLVASDSPAWLTAACFLAGMTLSYLTYETSLSAAEEYGDRLRAGFDLYRFDLLRQLRVKEPTSLAEERNLWGALQGVIILGLPPTREAEWMYQSAPVAQSEVRVKLSWLRQP